MMKEEEQQHISEAIEEIKPQLIHLSKFYNNLSLEDFLKKDKINQQRILSDLYENNSELEQLLRTIIDEDLNERTISTGNKK